MICKFIMVLFLTAACSSVAPDPLDTTRENGTTNRVGYIERR